MNMNDSKNVQAAREILTGRDEPPQALLELAGRLKHEQEFALARQVLSKAAGDRDAGHEWKVKINQQRALCTYQDTEEPLDARLDRALEILREEEDLATTANQETLGLAGAILKRKWQVYSQRQHLERSLSFYRRGYEQGVAGDLGYTGINAAYVLDLLASQVSTEDGDSAPADALRRKADDIRQDIVDKLPPLMGGNKSLEQSYWFLVTVAEAYFGLGRYEEAREWLGKAVALPSIVKWEYASTASQLANLARLQSTTADEGNAGENAAAGDAAADNAEVWKTLSVLLEDDTTAVRSAFNGKIGLALSGGGFRASLFHIGVLARLAELDVLRSVEVMSCVSGGSIIGAHYYLEVRDLLRRKTDGEITREDYIQIVQRIEREFLEGVQRNVRTRVVASWVANLRMLFSRTYTWSNRVGELYERELYSRTASGGEFFTGARWMPDWLARMFGYRRKPIWLNELLILPAGEDENSFKPKYDNWRRAAKAPVLILNATTLNTGHNWQFTANWMGEPASGINTEIDGNERLRRVDYNEAPEAHRRVRLGDAVAASACVPGLFPPLILADLYPKRIVRLVDGGVHDNQGIGGLLGEDCTVLLVSDASGQMNTLSNPSSSMFGSPLRSNSILMARVREAVYRELEARRRASLLRGLMFIHLKKEIDSDPVNWKGSEHYYGTAESMRPAHQRGPLTSYGIPKTAQERIAGIRTDLDSFSDREAYALIASGYRMTKYTFPVFVKGFPEPAGEQTAWRFRAVEKYLDPLQTADYDETLKHLRIAASGTLRAWKIGVPEVAGKLVLRLAKIVLFVVALGMLANFYFQWWALPWATLSRAGVASLVVVLAFVAVLVVLRFINRKTLLEVGIGLLLALPGFLLARLHLWTTDRLFLRLGRVKQ